MSEEKKETLVQKAVKKATKKKVAKKAVKEKEKIFIGYHPVSGEKVFQEISD